MRNYLHLLILLLGSSINMQCQTPTTGDPAFDAELNRLLSGSVPFIQVEELHTRLKNVVVLDTRDLKEYTVSHIPGAIHAGYPEPDPGLLARLDKDQPIVLYCSVGYRSEKTGEKLKAQGFTKLYNLYGSIFEWANKGYPMENGDGKQTHSIHTYNEEWSKWVMNPAIKKVW